MFPRFTTSFGLVASLFALAASRLAASLSCHVPCDLFSLRITIPNCRINVVASLKLITKKVQCFFLQYMHMLDVIHIKSHRFQPALLSPWPHDFSASQVAGRLQPRRHSKAERNISKASTSTRFICPSIFQLKAQRKAPLCATLCLICLPSLIAFGT